MDIRTLGEGVLRKQAQSVEKVDEEIRALVGRMIPAMYQAKGVGLAAPQIGISKRVVVIDPSGGTDMQKLLIMINPRIVEKGGRDLIEEGCLSLPGFRAFIYRFQQVTAEAVDFNGKSFRVSVDGLLAQAIQHETDHLDGVLFIDHLSLFDRLKYWKAINEIKKGTKARMAKK